MTQITKNTQDTLSKTYEKINKSLGSLEEVKESNYRTSLQICGIQIDKEKNIDKLIEVAGDIKAKEDFYERGATALEMNEYPVLKIEGYKPEDWLADIKLRIQILSVGERKNKLEKYRDRLSQFFTEEQKLSNLLEEIQNEV